VKHAKNYGIDIHVPYLTMKVMILDTPDTFFKIVRLYKSNKFALRSFVNLVMFFNLFEVP